MLNHQTVFTKYLRTAWRDVLAPTGQKMQPWGEWLSENYLCQCERCRQYGDYGAEVSYIEEQPGIDINDTYCDACIVRVWGWTNDEMFLAMTCPKGEESYWLQKQAEHYKDHSGLRNWGYEQE